MRTYPEVIKLKKRYNSQDQRDTMQANSDEERKNFQKIYGFVPENQDNIKKGYRGQEKDDWELKKKGFNHKEL